MIEPKRLIGPPATCVRCKTLAECPIEFYGQGPDDLGVPMVCHGKLCEDCFVVSQTNLAAFFEHFRK